MFDRAFILWSSSRQRFLFNQQLNVNSEYEGKWTFGLSDFRKFKLRKQVLKYRANKLNLERLNIFAVYFSFQIQKPLQKQASGNTLEKGH